MAEKLKAWWLFAVALAFLAGVGFISFQNSLQTPDATAWTLGLLFGLVSIAVFFLLSRARGGQDEYVVLITHLAEQDAALSPKRSTILSGGQGKVVDETLEMTAGRRTSLPTNAPYFDGEGKIAGLSSISIDLTERKRNEIARDAMLTKEHQSRVEAENATRARDEFLFLVAHELRSPLSAIRGWIHVLSNLRANETSRMQRALDGIKRNTELQAKLVDDLLDATQLISGKLTVEKQPFYLKPLLEEAVEAFQLAAKAEGIELSMACELGDEQINGEMARLSQVVRNLLSNAIKFSAEGARIELTARRSGAHVQISVSDTGAGIAAQDITHIFDRFPRADLFTHRRRGGLGLGLAVVRRLVELHGGTVKAESAGEGKGTTFTIELPLYDGPLVRVETRRFSAPAADEKWSYLGRPTELPTVPEKHSNHTSG